jgi:hypothetical protein
VARFLPSFLAECWRSQKEGIMFRSFLTTPEVLLLLSDDAEGNDAGRPDQPRERNLMSRLLRLTGWR